MVAAGADAAGAVLYGAALALIGVGCAAWGALAGQLLRGPAAGGDPGRGRDRRRPAGSHGRPTASTAWRWLHWLTPFGLLG